MRPSRRPSYDFGAIMAAHVAKSLKREGFTIKHFIRRRRYTSSLLVRSVKYSYLTDWPRNNTCASEMISAERLKRESESN